MAQKSEMSPDTDSMEDIKARFFDLFLGETRFYDRFMREPKTPASESADTIPRETSPSVSPAKDKKPDPIQLARKMRLRNIELLAPTRLSKTAMDWIGRDVVLDRHVLLRFFSKKTDASPYLKLSRYKSRALPTLYDALDCCGHKVLALEWYLGKNQPLRLDAESVRDLSFWKKLVIVRDVAGALARLHANGEAHGSLHPAHLFWFEEQQRVSILGFGEPAPAEREERLAVQADAHPMTRDIFGLGSLIVRWLPAFAAIGERCMQKNPMLRPSAESLSLFFRLYQEREYPEDKRLLETVKNLSLNAGKGAT